MRMSKVSCQWNKVETVGDSPSSRVGHTIVANKNDAYIFGGSCIVGHNGDTYVKYFNDTYKLSVGAKEVEWCKLQCNGATPTPRDYHSSLFYDDSIWVMGGKDNPSRDECLPGTYCLPLTTQTWKEVPTIGPAPKAIGFSLSFVNKNVITFGGLHNGQPVNDMFLLNISNGKSWVPVKANGTPPEPRCDHSTAVVNNDIFIFGGAIDANTYLNDLYKFNTETMTWYSIKDRGSVPDSSAGHSLLAHHDKDIYVVGGCQSLPNSTPVESIFKFSLTNEKWKRPLVAGDGPLSSALNGHCSILLHSKIYVIGGVGVQGEFDMKYIYVLNLINPSERKNLLDHFLTEDNQNSCCETIRKEQSDCLTNRTRTSTMDRKIANFDSEEANMLQNISKIVGELLDETVGNVSKEDGAADIHQAYREKMAHIIERFTSEREACMKLMRKERNQARDLINRFKEQNDVWWQNCMEANLLEKENIKKSWEEINKQRMLLEEERFHLEQKANMLSQLLNQL